MTVSIWFFAQPAETWAGNFSFFVDTETDQAFSRPSELPEDIREWLRPDIEVLGNGLLPQVQPYLRDGVSDLLQEHDEAVKSDVFGEALSFIIPKWWPHVIEVSLATDENGSVLLNQVFFVHGDQASHYNTNRGEIKTASDARRYFEARSELLEFGVIRRPEVQSPQLRTASEARILQKVFHHLEEAYGFVAFDVIAQSGAFPLMHDIAIKRGNLGCLIGASGVGDQLTFFRHYNENTSVTWANGFLDPIGQVQDFPKGTTVGVVHDARDNVVVIGSIQAYVEAANSAGIDITAKLDASASDPDRHDTVQTAVALHQQLCEG
ncbi:hypothetical protein [Thalassococcus sp. S3]|uniref:hypothetical protein n=1 Tax=Thalassococcus sp. S3 TaxID=2017482 RepID=UPI001024165A|nr:hypothetical protein [Thalassococcus sp. S3]QBF31707.1 hypothetical protein CFI11_10815 [Thalassococcus sp. S3]